MKSKIIASFVIILLFALFLTVLNNEERTYKVLDVNENLMICADINKNGKPDENEYFYLKNIKFIKNNPVFTYVSREYLKNLLIGKEVHLAILPAAFNKEPLQQAKITLDKKDIGKALLEEGLALPYQEGEYSLVLLKRNKEQFIKNIEVFNKYEIKDNKLCIKRKNQPVKTLDIIEPRTPDIVSKSIELYMINPLKYQRPSPHCRTSACQALLYNINNAKSSIDFVLFGMENQKEIYDALINAKKRGVKIRAVVDSNTRGEDVYPDTKLLRKTFSAVSDNSPILMHNKFFIFDNKKVLTGSMNISPTGSGGYNSNTVIVINSKDAANAYLSEFNQMYEGNFQKAKSPVQYESENLKIYFSPVMNIYQKAVSPEIKKAQKEILISAFYLTNREMFEDLIAAQKRGVRVFIIADALGASNFKERINYLRNNGINVKVENFGGKNHTKDITIDGKVLITGSANFSKNAVYKNDENIVVINNPVLANYWRTRFFALYNSIDNKYLRLFPRAEGFESKYSCYDGIDNDFDGKIDSQDEGCQGKRIK